MSITEDHSESQVYELAYLILPSIPEEDLLQVVAKIQKTIEKAGGEKVDSEDPFLRELAYEMSKTVGASRYVVKNAYLGWIKFDLPLPAEAEKHPIEVIKNEIEKMAEVLRFLLAKASRETKFTFASTRAVKIEPEESLVKDDVAGEVILGEEIPEPVEEPDTVVTPTLN